jgi:hypothetical protein
LLAKLTRKPSPTDVIEVFDDEHNVVTAAFNSDRSEFGDAYFLIPFSPELLEEVDGKKYERDYEKSARDHQIPFAFLDIVCAGILNEKVDRRRKGNQASYP